MCLLMGQYFLQRRIVFFPSGTYSQIVEEQVEYQADLSYCFGTIKDVSDLFIEIVITSGSAIKLQKYRLMDPGSLVLGRRHSRALPSARGRLRSHCYQ